MTGIAAGISSGFPVFEAEQQPGGICRSYYLRPGVSQRLTSAPDDGASYRFEIGGGHWIFGGDPLILHFLESLDRLTVLPTPLRRLFSRKRLLCPLSVAKQFAFSRPENNGTGPPGNVPGDDYPHQGNDYGRLVAIQLWPYFIPDILRSVPSNVYRRFVARNRPTRSL